MKKANETRRKALDSQDEESLLEPNTYVVPLMECPTWTRRWSWTSTRWPGGARRRYQQERGGATSPGGTREPDMRPDVTLSNAPSMVTLHTAIAKRSRLRIDGYYIHSMGRVWAWRGGDWGVGLCLWGGKLGASCEGEPRGATTEATTTTERLLQLFITAAVARG